MRWERFRRCWDELHSVHHGGTETRRRFRTDPQTCWKAKRKTEVGWELTIIDCAGCDASKWRCISSLSPACDERSRIVLGGEGWGEGRLVEWRCSQEWPLTPTLSPEYGGEGARSHSPQCGVTPDRASE